MSSDQFWMLTAREFCILGRRRTLADKERWTQTAMIACTIANVNRPARTKAYTIEDFMPSKSAHPSQTPDQQAVMLQLAAASFGKAD